MADILGVAGPLVLLADGDRAVVVNSDLNLVSVAGSTRELSLLHEWEVPLVFPELLPETRELAAAALVSLSIEVVTAAGGQRMYTIPEAAVAEAKKALKWRAEHNRGGTPVGMNTARTLARGGQIGLRKVRHIAKYFPRHEIDKKGKGWRPGEDGFPSRGRIAWALWGGDPAWRWARQIVERENNKAKTASGAYDEYDPMVDYTYDLIDAPVPAGADVDAFREAHEMDGDYGPEFLARVRLDGSGMDRLYKIDPSGNVYVWDDGQWDDLGQVGGDIYQYDTELDDPYDRGVEKSHIVIDPDSAVLLSARLHANPSRPVSVEELDDEEAKLAMYALSDEDWAMVDRVVVAAGEAVGTKPGAGDGVYTEEERSENASKQVRDATGKFAAAGSRVVVGNDTKRGKGVITGINGATKMVTVKLDNGQTVTVPANTTQKLVDKKIVTTAGEDLQGPLDTSGILGQPRTPIDRPGATLPGTLPRMTKDDLHSLLTDWPSYVQSQRAKFNPFTEKQVRSYAKTKGYKIKDKPGTMVSDGPTDVKRDTK